MPELSREHLFSASVPAEWEQLLDDLAQLVALAEGGAPLAERRARALELHPRILEEAGQRLGQSLPSSLLRSDPAHIRRLCEAVLLWPYFARVGGRPLYDSLQLVSLNRFPIDLPVDVDASGALRSALSVVLGVSEDQLDQAQATAELLVGNLAVKNVICEWFAARCEGADQAEARLQIFQYLYGDVGWASGEVDLVVTWSHLFFCLPYEGVDYSGDRDACGEGVDAFLIRVRDQNTFITGRFPAFGTFDADSVDPALIEALRRALQQRGLDVPTQVIAQTLPTMVTVTPTSKAEQYLVHDCWGHGWQEALCDFEWLYGELTKVRRPITADDLRPSLSEGQLDERDLIVRVHADLEHRILCAHHAHTSEVLADLIECKLARMGSPLPTSSLLPSGTVKLDLSLTDALTHARVWAHSWKRLWMDPRERARVAAELGPGSREVVDRAAQVVKDEFEPVWADAVSERESFGDRIGVVTFERIWLQSAAMDAELTKLMEWGDRAWERHEELERWRVPESCVDLIALVLGWVYEQDPARHVWFLDDYAQSLREFLGELGTALRDPDQR